MLGNTLCWGQRGDFESLGVVNYPTELYMFYSAHYLKPSERHIENYILHSVCSERPDNLAGENSEMHWKLAEQSSGCGCAQCEADVNVNEGLWMGECSLSQPRDWDDLDKRIHQDTLEVQIFWEFLRVWLKGLETSKLEWPRNVGKM